MTVVTPPYIVRKLLKRYTWRLSNKPGAIYLTFDDGPTPGVTTWVLAQLKQYGARATFFCIGRNVERHSDLYQQILEAGHATGNHTYSHLNGRKVKDPEYLNDISLASKIVRSDLFRPPYGMIKASQGKNLSKDYRIVMWDVLSYDFSKNTSPEKCYNNVMKKVMPGSVIVFHDSEKAWPNLSYALPRILEEFTTKGYTFEPINNTAIEN